MYNCTYVIVNYVMRHRRKKIPIAAIRCISRYVGIPTEWINTQNMTQTFVHIQISSKQTNEKKEEKKNKYAMIDVSMSTCTMYLVPINF